jgi:cytochrome c oxidase subunit 1
MHLTLCLFSLGVGCVYALLTRVLASVDGERALSMVRLHGFVMVFTCLLPMLGAVLGNLVLPGVLGVTQLAFPRLHRLAFRAHFLGFLALLAAVLSEGAAPGFLFLMARGYTRHDGAVVFAMLSALLMACSSACVGVSIVASVHAARRQAGGFRGLSPLATGLDACALLHVLTAPLLLATLGLTLWDAWQGAGLFDGALGGDPVLFEALLGTYVYPALTGALIAAMGGAAHVLLREGARDVFTAVRISAYALALLSLGSVGRHLYTAGISGPHVLRASVMALASEGLLVAVTLSFVRALVGVRLRYGVATLYALGFFVLLALAVPQGVLLAMPSPGALLHASVFATAHMHYLYAGGCLFAGLAVVHAQCVPETADAVARARRRIAFVAVFAGFNLAFLPMCLLGARGAGRPLQAEQVSTLVNGLMGGGMLLLTGGLLLAVFAALPRNPGRAGVPNEVSPLVL